MSHRHQPFGRSSEQVPPARGDGFVELDRKFSPLPKNDDRENSADDSYLSGIFGSPQPHDWLQLLQKRVVVILGEPGSGKTREMEHQADRLSRAGEFAAFLRLEYLIGQPILDVLGASAQAFEEWKASDGTATFFLDSVDESKLNSAEDFYSALRRFKESLPPDFRTRTKIVLSSRISEWHPDTDGARVRQCFEVPADLVKKSNDEDDEVINTKPGEEHLLVVQIVPLESEQVATFIRAIGVAKPEDFLKALDEAHAWEFARRPIDVRELVSFWRSNGRIGSLTELIESELQRNLCERRPHSHDPLSAEDARDGAEALAAGTVFCGIPRIMVTDEALTSTGLDGRVCVPERFTREQFEALLTRPIFDGESHGHVRFHHRRLKEYLAASWVTRRLKDGCSMEDVEGLFFDQIGGRRVLRASRAAVAAWLCGGGEPFNLTLRKWVLEASPGLNLRFGDPHALPLDYRQSILARLTEEAKSRGSLWLQTDQDALSRLAHPELVPEIEKIIRNRQIAVDLRTAMIETVRHGRLTVCLSALLDVVRDPGEADDIKVSAVAALRDLGDTENIASLANIARALPHVTTSLTDVLVAALFPARLSVEELVELLRKTRDSRGEAPDVRWRIKGPLEEKLQPAQAASLLHHLVDLLRLEPTSAWTPTEMPVSETFKWIRPLSVVALTCLMKLPALTPDEANDAAAALAFIAPLHREHELTEEGRITIRDLSLNHPNVRQRYFWATVQRCRPLGQGAIDHPIMLFGHPDDVLEPSSSDLEWLLEDLATLKDDSDKEVALRHAMHWFNRVGRPRHLRRKIRRSIGGSAQLLPVLRELDRAGSIAPFRRIYFQAQQQYWTRRHQVTQKRHWLNRHVHKLRNWWFLRKNMARIATGELPDATSWLVTGADPDNRERLTITKWHALERVWGPNITTAARQGCKVLWRAYRPELPHECADLSKLPYQLTVGLTGLHAAWLDKELVMEALSAEDVKLATRYALREINGFPRWFPKLAKSRPDVVGSLLGECVTAEWKKTAGSSPAYDALNRLAWSGVDLVPLVGTRILDHLRTGDPVPQVLACSLTILTRSTTPPIEQICTLARGRLASTATTTASLALWFSLWLQAEPDAALDAWATYVQDRTDATEVMVAACAGFQDRVVLNRPHLASPKHLAIPVLRRLVPLVHMHIRFEDDVHRRGSYSPVARDDAQEYRGALLRILAESSDPEAAEALSEFMRLSTFLPVRDRLIHLREESLKLCADRERWKPAAIRQFSREYEADPSTDNDLFKIALRRFSDIKRDVEISDLGLRSQLREGDKEYLLRRWIAQQLINRSRKRYTVPQEAVIDQEERPDIRLENPNAGFVSIEVKWANRWNFGALTAALEDQLLGRYLRAHTSRYGILVLGLIEGKYRSWRWTDGRMLEFQELICMLRAQASELEKQHPEVRRLEVVGIDFRNPTNTKQSSPPDFVKQ